jgi:hypothetical protein
LNPVGERRSDRFALRRSEASEGALAKLSESSIVYPEAHAEWACETLALRIIETVQKRGERDLERVRDDALLHLAQAEPPPRFD